MAYTTIDKPSDYFNTVLYTGNGSTNAITGVNFQPDWVWVKRRNGATKSMLYDIARSANFLQTESTDAEQDGASFFVSLDSDGFTFEGSDSSNNASSQTYVAWNWLASNTTASNTDGSITSTVSANTTSGFSIVTTTGTGANATIGHGLGVAPSMIIGKRRDAGSSNWRCYNKNLTDANYIILLDTTGAEQSGNTATWQGTDPTSSIFYVGTSGDVNASGGTFVFYCFAEKKGFSKFGSYTGNGNADGTFIYTGFKPAMVIYKNISSVYDWIIEDNKRSAFNLTDDILYPNTSGIEDTGSGVDFLSNGVKLRSTANKTNRSGDTYIYMAFAENPFVTSTGIPCTAR